MPPILHEALVELVDLGGRETRKGRFDSGEALDWSHLNFEDRKKAIECIVQDTLEKRTGSKNESGSIFIHIKDLRSHVLIHGIPSTITNAAAREMVGRPFIAIIKLQTDLDLEKVGQSIFLHAIVALQSVKLLIFLVNPMLQQ